MPLIQGRSKQAVGENIKTEMRAGKPQKQAIAVALSVQRRAKRKKMASGGPVEVDAASERRVSVDSLTPEEMDMINARRRMASGGAVETDFASEGKADADNAETPEDMSMAHGHSMEHGAELDARKKGRQDADSAASERDENMLDARPTRHSDETRAASEEVSADKGGDYHSRDMLRQSDPKDAYDERGYVRMAKGGKLQMDMEADMHEPKSVADAVMHRRKQRMSEMPKMADGGEVDLSRNADEDPNEEDQMSFGALRKENYSESDALDDANQPEDSNEHGDELSDEDAHGESMIDEIRRRMLSKRGWR